MTEGQLAIVIPAFNEAKMILKIVADARKLYPKAMVIVVDDCSWDETAELAKGAGAVVISHIFNIGYGSAIHTGLTYALKAGAEMVVTMDADGQHDIAEVKKLLDAVRTGLADVALGSRFLPGSGSYRVAFVRRVGMWLFAQLTSLLAKQRISDPTTGFQCMNRKALRLYVEIPDFPEMYPDADMILFAVLLGCRVLEVPVRMFPNRTGKSMHGGLKSILYVPKMLLAMAGILLGKNYLLRRLKSHER